ncbi:hypothetical protein GCM10027612_67310 [Microbispora bryophytorum subsp. camponoti]
MPGPIVAGPVVTGPIVVGTDGSPAATAAVRWAADDAARRGCPLRFVSVVDHWAYGIPKFPVSGGDPLTAHAERALSAAEAVARERQPDVEISTEIIEGIPSRVLRDKAKEAVEIVLGSRGFGGFAGLVIGSVSTHVAGQARCPVVVVRPGWTGERGRSSWAWTTRPNASPRWRTHSSRPGRTATRCGPCTPGTCPPIRSRPRSPTTWMRCARPISV